MERWCTQCQQWKDQRAFALVYDMARPQKRRSYCRQCEKQRPGYAAKQQRYWARKVADQAREASSPTPSEELVLRMVARGADWDARVDLAITALATVPPGEPPPKTSLEDYRDKERRLAAYAALQAYLGRLAEDQRVWAVRQQAQASILGREPVLTAAWGKEDLVTTSPNFSRGSGEEEDGLQAGKVREGNPLLK